MNAVCNFMSNTYKVMIAFDLSSVVEVLFFLFVQKLVES